MVLPPKSAKRHPCTSTKMKKYVIENGDVFEVLNDRGGRANKTLPPRLEIQGFYELANMNVDVKVIEREVPVE